MLVLHTRNEDNSVVAKIFDRVQGDAVLKLGLGLRCAPAARRQAQPRLLYDYYNTGVYYKTVHDQSFPAIFLNVVNTFLDSFPKT